MACRASLLAARCRRVAGVRAVVTHVGYEVVELSDLIPFPGNPRVGDLGAIKESLVRFGQYRSIVVWATEGKQFIVAGNHTRLAMLELSQMDPVTYEQTYASLVGGSEHLRSFSGKVRVEFGEFESWDEARRVNAADNRLAERGGYDESLLLPMLESFAGDWAGSGWGPEDLARLRADFEPSGEPPPPLDQLTPKICPQCGYDVANDPDGLAQ